MSKESSKQYETGFTLIELLIVIAVMAILTSIVFVALNPLARFQDSRNTRRRTDVVSILNAIKLYETDNDGLPLADMEAMTVGVAYALGDTGACPLTCVAPDLTADGSCIDIGYLVGLGYLPVIPVDPNAPGASVANAHYYLIKNSGGSLTVGACDEEKGTNEAIPNISVTK
jgi:prepilin-type N-terminal cleavage/methylation domain-containing protein